MKYIALIFGLGLGWYYAVICNQYDKAAFFISLCVLFTQWVCPPSAPRTAPNPKAYVAPASGAHVQRVVGCELSNGENNYA